MFISVGRRSTLAGRSTAYFGREFNGRILDRPPATRQTDREMAGQILENREVAGQLSAKIKTDREVAGQLKGRKTSDRVQTGRPQNVEFIIYQNFGLVKFFLDRFVAGRSAHGLPFNGQSVGQPLHGRSVSWPATSRSVR
ncbi:hypothetical protein BpHYR1_001038 [Brachionus plicatilis]|uniref:Uncharacterized protein n=1 Tax=Brachionus plicatilis TaxID=10195 RepID=A0A3M7QDZ4_BRAPC|nr:hypothetical protein BpHYR1_001038 [Brachionus plicatilis]